MHLFKSFLFSWFHFFPFNTYKGKYDILMNGLKLKNSPQNRVKRQITQNRDNDVCIHYEMITALSLVIICPHVKLLQYYHIPYAVYYILVAYVFCN